MSKKKNLPEIRFKGFDDEWEESYLKHLTDMDFSNGIFKDPEKVGKGYRLINVKDMYSGDCIDVNSLSLVDIDEKEFKKNKVEYGDIFFTRSSLVKEGIAFSNINLSHRNDLTFDGHLIRMQPCKTKTNPIFLAYLFKTSSARKQFILGGKTTTMTTIGQNDIAVVELALPSNKIEQSRIGSYLQHLDKLINLHQKKYDKLVALKKAMLEKMFPKDGSDVPVLRFIGFTDKWEERKLGEISTIKTGFPFDSKDFNDNGEFLVITNGNIQNESPNVDGTIGNRINIENNATKNEYILKPNDILVTMDGTVGRTAKVFEQKQILAQRVGRLIAKSEPEFLYQLLNTGDFYKKMVLISHGGTIKHISLNEISCYIAYIPTTREEQTKIGSYFRNLDRLISLHQKELDKLKNIKKACLEKMFV